MAQGLALLFPEKDLERIIWKTVVWAIERNGDQEKEGGYLPAGGENGDVSARCRGRGVD